MRFGIATSLFIYKQFAVIDTLLSTMKGILYKSLSFGVVVTSTQGLPYCT